MSEDNADQGSKRPSHIAYQVRDAENDKSYFNKIGAGWEHKDGKGYNIQLDSVPIDGRITLRTPMERLEEMRNEPQPDPHAQLQEQQQALQEQDAPQQKSQAEHQTPPPKKQEPEIER